MEQAVENARICDFGVGQGQFEQLLERFSQKLAADFFPYPDANVICDLTKPLPFRDAAFDIAIASNVFEYIPNTQDVLTECRRILKPNGRIIGMIPFLLGVHQEPYDFHRYTPFMLHQLLERAGFQHIEISTLTNPIDVYLHTQKHFFYRLFAHAASLGRFHRILAKLIWWCERLLSGFIRGFFHRISKDSKYTIGYGFTALNKGV